MSASLVRLFALAFLICAGTAAAQVQPAPPKAAEHTIADIIQWVRRDGTEAVMSHDVARIFGWGDADVVVIRMAFVNPESHASFALDVVRDRPNVVVISRDPNEMIVWQMSGEGELQKTLHASKAGVVPVDNALYQAKWREALAVFFNLIPETSGTGR